MRRNVDGAPTNQLITRVAEEFGGLIWMQYKQCTHSDIISARHGAAIQAVRRLQRKFRMRRREWHELHQWPRMLEDHVAIAKCYLRGRKRERERDRERENSARAKERGPANLFMVILFFAIIKFPFIEL